VKFASVNACLLALVNLGERNTNGAFTLVIFARNFTLC
jgi:hypothetical protein